MGRRECRRLCDADMSCSGAVHADGLCSLYAGVQRPDTHCGARTFGYVKRAKCTCGTRFLQAKARLAFCLNT